MSTRRKSAEIILILVGPSGSGKSRLAMELKPVLQRYGVKAVLASNVTKVEDLAGPVEMEWGSTQ